MQTIDGNQDFCNIQTVSHCKNIRMQTVSNRRRIFLLTEKNVTAFNVKRALFRWRDAFFELQFAKIPLKKQKFSEEFSFLSEFVSSEGIVFLIDQGVDSLLLGIFYKIPNANGRKFMTFWYLNWKYSKKKICMVKKYLLSGQNDSKSMSTWKSSLYGSLVFRELLPFSPNTVQITNKADTSKQTKTK